MGEEWGLGVLVSEAVRLLVATLAVIVAPVLIGVLVRWLQWLGLTLDAERQAKLEKIVQDAVLAVEEWAAARAKRGVKIAAETKLRQATERIVSRWPGLTPEEAERLVQAALPRLGLGAAGWLGAVRRAVTTPPPPRRET